QAEDSLNPGDVLVRPAVKGFTSLNFSAARVDQLIRNGRAAAETAFHEAPCFSASSAPPPARPTRIASITIASTNASERLAILRLLGLGLSDTLDLALLRSRVQNLAHSEAFRAVWLSPHGAGDSVAFDVAIQRSARRMVGLGLAYDNELGGRMWAGAVERRLFNLALEASTVFALGEFRKELYVGLRRNYQLGRQLMTPTLTTRLALESVRRFDAGGEELDPSPTREAIGFLGVERVFDPGWQIALGFTGHAWHEPGKSQATAGVVARGIKATPARAPVLQTSLLWTGLYYRADFDGSASLKMGRFQLRPRLRLGWGDRLPLPITFPLGGEDGFPGLHLGERRGDREALLGLLFSYDLVGPFLARLEVVTGRSAFGGRLLDSQGWLTGVRAGVGAQTPVGPVRLEYGIANGGRDAVFVRLGRWF
ncbi:MAG: hypothetical protein M3Q75_07645, partial [Gemmatimonadota bacterium]|nr:hypothetical protein [Gemmatimonadota bacterium]